MQSFISVEFVCSVWKTPAKHFFWWNLFSRWKTSANHSDAAKKPATPTLTTSYDEPAVRWHRNNPQNGADYQTECAPEQESSLEAVLLQLNFPLGLVDGGCVWHLVALFARLFILLFGKVGSRLFFFLFLLFELRNFTKSLKWRLSDLFSCLFYF